MPNPNLDAKSAAPAKSAVAVTPSDTADLAGGSCRALFVGTGGNLNVDMDDGATVLFSNVSAGILPIQVKRVRNTSTTAANIIALY